MAKLTVKELLDHKEKIKGKRRKRADIYVESLDAEISVKAPNGTLISEAQSLGTEDATKADAYLVYESVTEPSLKSKELQDAYGCVEPMDIVEELFLPGEIASIASELMKLAGFGSKVSLVDEVKN